MRALLAALLLACTSAMAADGAAIYAAHCQACHQADGEGAPGVAPPLKANVARHAGSGDGRAYLARVPLTGMVGRITVAGVRYAGANMPSFATLPDADIAAVLGHVLREFNAIGDLAWLTPEFVAAVRQAGGSPNQTHQLRGRLGGGD